MLRLFCNNKIYILFYVKNTMFIPPIRNKLISASRKRLLHKDKGGREEKRRDD